MCSAFHTHTEPFPFEQLVWLHLVVIYLHAPANWFVGKTYLMHNNRSFGDKSNLNEVLLLFSQAFYPEVSLGLW